MTYDVILIGAGIIGLTTAWTLKRNYPELNILILEKDPDVAGQQTGHNSGVIHSGIYYKPGSLKAKNCLRGYQWMIDYCQSRAVHFDICSKIIVATNQEEDQLLKNILDRGQKNGLQNLKWIGAEEIQEREPHCQGTHAIYVPQAGIVNYRTVCHALKNELAQLGVEVRFDSKVQKVTSTETGFLIDTNESIPTRFLFTMPGMYSDRIAQWVKPGLDYRVVPFRGEYYELQTDSEHLVKNLIYPVANPKFPFLGVHFTRMIDGGVECGPNAVLALSREGYTWGQINLRDLFQSLTWPGMQKIMWNHWRMGLGEVHRSWSKSAFTRALQKLIPEIQSSDLKPGKAGVRAQACNRNGLVDDYWVEKGENFVLVLNSPSPAATSSFSIALQLSDEFAALTGREPGRFQLD